MTKIILKRNRSKNKDRLGAILFGAAAIIFSLFRIYYSPGLFDYLLLIIGAALVVINVFFWDKWYGDNYLEYDDELLSFRPPMHFRNKKLLWNEIKFIYGNTNSINITLQNGKEYSLIYSYCSKEQKQGEITEFLKSVQKKCASAEICDVKF